ncbi:MAG: hypothetical protein ACNA78_07645 [Balneolaceae bacterium]
MAVITRTVLFSFCLIASCNTATMNKANDLNALLDTIEQLVGTTEAGDPGQCRMLPFGSKPMGGPWGYLVYSAADTDEEKLREAVEAYNRLDADRNREESLMSTGDMATPPTLIIKNGQCHGEGIYAIHAEELESFKIADSDS